MASVKYYLRDSKSDKETLIYMVLSLDGTRSKFTTQESIHPKHWNQHEQKVRKSFPGFESLNDTLKKKAEDFQKAVRLLKNLNARITAQSITEKVDFINNHVNNGHTTFLRFIQEFIEASQFKVAHGTRKSYKTTLEVLKRFQASKNRRLEFNNIDLKFYYEFNLYLYKDLDYSMNTVGKHIKNIKVFMKEATERNLNNNMDFLKKGFKVGKEDIDNIYLSEDELKVIYDLDLSDDKRMEHVRDLFIVGCYTGLRFSDFSQIKRENIRNGLISLRVQKTKELVSVPVHPLIENIMNKYKGTYSNSLPPAYPNQIMNRYLKDIGERARFFEEVSIKKTKGGKRSEQLFSKCELITTHTARRSFATNLFLQEFPAISIMRITGHRSEKNFLNYVKMTPLENADKLRRHWEKVYDKKED